MIKSLVNISSSRLKGKVTAATFFTKLGLRARKFSPAASTVATCIISYGACSWFLEKKDEEVSSTIDAIKAYEIYPKIYRLANGNISARTALGYRIDPSYWEAWEYLKLIFQRFRERRKDSDASSNVMTPLVARFLLPVCGSRRKGVLQVWASRQKQEDAWELERMELHFKPAKFVSPNLNANAEDMVVSEDGSIDEENEDWMTMDQDWVAIDDDLSTWTNQLDLTEASIGTERETIVLWIDSGIPPRSQLEDPSVDVASLPDMNDPWKIDLDDFEEPAVEYIDEV